MIKCPKCSSTSIVEQRVDSDWHNNPATAVNEKSAYSADEWRALENGRKQYDIETLICMDCSTRFLDTWNEGPVPGDTKVLVKTDSGIYIASFNTGRWVLQDHKILVEPVVCWIPLP